MISLYTGIVGIAVAVLILVLIRKDRLHVTHGLGWVFVAAAFAFLGFAPQVIDHIAKFFGVAYPPAIALTLAVAILVIKILLMDIERSRIELRNQRLIQRVAILELEIKKLASDGDVPADPDQEKLLNVRRK